MSILATKLKQLITKSSKDVFPENDLLERATALKRFVYYSLGKELKKQTSVAVKKYQILI